MTDDKPCTCHPSEAPVPCQRQYAFTECELSKLRADLAAARARIVELCACLEDARPYVLDAAKNTEEIARIDAALGVTAFPDAH